MFPVDHFKENKHLRCKSGCINVTHNYESLFVKNWLYFWSLFQCLKVPISALGAVHVAVLAVMNASHYQCFVWVPLSWVLVSMKIGAQRLCLGWTVICPAKTWITKLVSVPSRSGLVFVSACKHLPSISLLCKFTLKWYRLYQFCIFFVMSPVTLPLSKTSQNWNQTLWALWLAWPPKDCVGLTGFRYLFRVSADLPQLRCCYFSGNLPP